MGRTVLLTAILLGCAALARGAPDAVPPITVEAARDRAALQHRVDGFVNHALTRPHAGDSLLRWDHAVCPLVAGLPLEGGEFLLRRISEIAVAVRAPLDGPKCHPNLFVLVTPNPEGLLRLWWNRNPRLFDIGRGVAPVKHFIETPRPVRVWHNAYDIDADFGSSFNDLLAASAGATMGTLDYPTLARPALGSRLTRTVVRNIGSAIVVVDSTQASTLGIGQLADYIALISLADLDEDADTGDAPTLLRLFRTVPAERPSQMTAWDQALLRGLYGTRQKNTTQVSELEAYVVNDLIANSRSGGP